MKKLIKRLALWMLEWADEAEIKNIKINEKVSFELSKLLVKPDKWYHMAYTVSFWNKRDKKKKTSIEDFSIFVDGKTLRL